MSNNFTSEDIYRIVVDLNNTIKDGRIQAVFQPLKEELYLEIYLRHRIIFLLISIENGFNRIYLTDSKPENPPNPFSFQMLLRKYLLPSYIDAILQINNDRVVKVSLGEFNIYAELTGRHANIFLTDSNEIILGSMRENLSQKRPLFPSHKYIPPFGRETKGISPHKIPDVVDIQSYYSQYYEKLIREQRLIRLKSELLRSLNREISHLQNVLKKIDEDKERALRYKDYLRYAEALKQNWIVEKRDDFILCEYYTESGVVSINVPAIKGKKIFEIMEYYFKLYKRYKNSLKVIFEREKEICERLNTIKNKIDNINQLNDMEALNKFNLRVTTDNATKIESYIRNKERPPYKVYYVEGVGRIYSGTDARENEQLTFRYSRGNDLWFHVIGYSGAHIVLPVPKDKIPSEKQILTAALLAAARSSAPEGETVEVAYTRVKYVRRVKGQTRGAVTFSNEKRLLVKVDKKFLHTLILIS